MSTINDGKAYDLVIYLLQIDDMFWLLWLQNEYTILFIYIYID